MNVAELDERIAKCERLLSANPNSQIFAALADALRRKGELDKAFQVCQNGLKIHPSYGSGHAVMAKINMDRGLYDWAELEAKKALEIDGSTRSVQLLLAEIYIYRGDVRKAIRLLTQLQEANPASEQIGKLLSIARKIPADRMAMYGEQPPDDEDSEEEGVTRPDVYEPPAIELTERDLIEKSRTMREVDGALFVDREGMIVESNWSLPYDPARCAAGLGDLKVYADEDLSHGVFGRVLRALVETDGPVFYVIRVDNGVLLFAARRQASLGALRMKIDKLLDRYFQAVEVG